MNEEQSKQEKGTMLYFYLQKGVSLLNEFKNLLMLIFAIYLSLKLTNWWWLIILFVSSLPILTLVGWYFNTYMAAVMEKLAIKHGTFYQIRQFTIIEESLAEQKQINEQLKEINEKLNK